MIDDTTKLAEFLPKVKSAPWIALDTEADSLHAYPEKICLVQISIPGHDVLVDPLAGLDLNPLLRVLAHREIILHGADYDLRMLWRTFRFQPHAVFDTMWAGRLLGHAEFGLTHLVASLLGIALEKGPQTMNWARRPLTERMEKYARNDTHYLQSLQETLQSQLEQKGRLGWLRETCAQLIQDCSQDRVQDPEGVWRIKGSHRLDRKGLAVLREFWHWREGQAIERNRPPYFVLSHEALISLAEASALGRPLDGLLPRRFSYLQRRQLCDIAESVLSQPGLGLPKVRRSVGQRLTKAEQERFDSLKRRRDQRAAELNIDPTLIASRTMLLTLVQDWDSHQKELLNWQKEMLA